MTNTIIRHTCHFDIHTLRTHSSTHTFRFTNCERKYIPWKAGVMTDKERMRRVATVGVGAGRKVGTCERRRRLVHYPAGEREPTNGRNEINSKGTNTDCDSP